MYQALAGEVCIYWSSKDQQLVLREVVLHLEVVNIQPDCDVLVVKEHVLKHFGVAICRKSLEIIIEISVISVGPVRKAS
jgi:hypothetical protein